MSVSRLSQTSVQNALQKYNNVWDGRSAAGSMDCLGSYYFPANTSPFAFSSIPQTYTHLQLRLTTRITNGGATDSAYLRFNGDSTAAHYYNITFQSDGSTVTAPTQNPASYGTVSVMPGGGSTAGIYGVTIIDILDYTNTNKNKTTRAIGGYDANGTGVVNLCSFVWVSTAAITDITVGGYTTAMIAGTTAALYGIK